MRTEKAVKRTRRGVELIEKRSQELMSLLGLEGTLDRLARASGVRWYGHVSRKGGDDVLRKSLDFEVVARRRCGRPTMWSTRQVEEHTKQI